MTLIQSSTFTGVNVNDVRPHARGRQLQDLKNIAKDQAMAFESITGRKVPPASGAHAISATPHVHDGTTGAIIPIPVVQEWVGGEFSPSTSTTGDFAKFAWSCFFAPAGVTTMRVFVLTSTPAIINHMRARGWDDTLTVVSTADFSALNPEFHDYVVEMTGRVAVYADVTVTPGLSAISLEIYDGNQQNGVPIFRPLTVDSYTIVPWAGPPRRVSAYFDPDVSSSEYVVPASTQYLGGGADTTAFTSYDDGMFTDGRAVGSFLTQPMSLNDALLWEILAGRPAGDNTDGHTNDAHYIGHNHGGASSGWLEIGDDIDQPLVACSWGVGRQRAASSQFFTVDEPTTPAADWSGRIYAAHISTTSTAPQTLAEIPFRMPTAQSANIQGSGRLRFAVLAYYDAGKAVTCNVTGKIYDDTGASGGSTCTIDFTTSSTPDIVDSGSSGWYLSTATIDYYGAGGVNENGDQALLEVGVNHGTSPANTPTIAVYSVCLYYDAA